MDASDAVNPALIPVDPAILVWAARGVLGHRGHAAVAIACEIRANAAMLPPAARQALARDITGWLDGPGALADPADRQPWAATVAALGGEPLDVWSPLAPQPAIPTQRRRTDQRATA